MNEEIIKLVGKENGTTSMILVGVHGNEKCGVEALQNILHNLEIERGVVLFGYGNPRAIDANVRYTEANLNRMFKDVLSYTDNEKNSYEYGRAQFLKTYFNQVDALLDVHASFTPQSKPFVICEANAKDVVTYLPVDLIVSGFDVVEPGGTDYYMNSIGKIGICVECGYLGDSLATTLAENSILAFLAARGHITRNLTSQKQSFIRMNELYITKTNTFTLSKQFHDFEEISQNEIIGMDGNIEVKADKDCIILFARNREQINSEAFLLGMQKNTLTK